MPTGRSASFARGLHAALYNPSSRPRPRRHCQCVECTQGYIATAEGTQSCTKCTYPAYTMNTSSTQWYVPKEATPAHSVPVHIIRAPSVGSTAAPTKSTAVNRHTHTIYIRYMSSLLNITYSYPTRTHHTRTRSHACAQRRLSGDILLLERYIFKR